MAQIDRTEIPFIQVQWSLASIKGRTVCVNPLLYSSTKQVQSLAWSNRSFTLLPCYHAIASLDARLPATRFALLFQLHRSTTRRRSLNDDHNVNKDTRSGEFVGYCSEYLSVREVVAGGTRVLRIVRGHNIILIEAMTLRSSTRSTWT